MTTEAIAYHKTSFSRRCLTLICRILAPAKIRLFCQAIHERGVINTVQASVAYLADSVFDLRHGTDTFSFVEVDNLGVVAEKQAHAVMYQPTLAIALRRLLRSLEFPSGKVFVDLGCGKGRTLLVASDEGFSEVRGVDLSPQLTDIAKANCSIYRDGQMQATWAVYLSDARDYAFQDDEQVFYLFHPFDDTVLSVVMQNLATDLDRHPRTIWIIYRHAVYRELVEEILSPDTSTTYTCWGFDFVVMKVDRKAPSETCHLLQK